MNDENMKQQLLNTKQLAGYRKMPRDKQIEMWRGILESEGIAFEVVRDFLIFEVVGKGENLTPSSILHIPSGLGQGFALPYDVALEMLKNSPEQDATLISILFNE